MPAAPYPACCRAMKVRNEVTGEQILFHISFSALKLQHSPWFKNAMSKFLMKWNMTLGTRSHNEALCLQKGNLPLQGKKIPQKIPVYA